MWKKIKPFRGMFPVAPPPGSPPAYVWVNSADKIFDPGGATGCPTEIIREEVFVFHVNIYFRT